MLDTFSNSAPVVRLGQKIGAHESSDRGGDDSITIREQDATNFSRQPPGQGSKRGSDNRHDGRPDGGSNRRTNRVADWLSNLFRYRCRTLLPELSKRRFNTLLNSSVVAVSVIHDDVGEYHRRRYVGRNVRGDCQSYGMGSITNVTHCLCLRDRGVVSYRDADGHVIGIVAERPRVADDEIVQTEIANHFTFHRPFLLADFVVPRS